MVFAIGLISQEGSGNFILESSLSVAVGMHQQAKANPPGFSGTFLAVQKGSIGAMKLFFPFFMPPPLPCSRRKFPISFTGRLLGGVKARKMIL